MVPVAGDAQSVERIRERIEFTSNLLFLIEDLYLALGPGFVTTQVSTKVDARSPLYWVRNQLATRLKELMIAKRTGWQVLNNLKNQVCNLISIIKGPFDGVDSFVVVFVKIKFDKNDSGYLSWISASFRLFLCYVFRRFLFKIDMSTCRSVQGSFANF